MSSFITALVWTLAIMASLQVVFTLLYLTVLRPYWTRSPLMSESEASSFTDIKVAIVLCLRGADPFLPNCIHALLQQDYPTYELHIVVDSETDPAWAIVQQVLADAQPVIPVKVSPLTQPRSTCSLKCSALIQAVSGLNAVDIIALVDADTIAHPHWLQELVKPLARDPKIGITTGIRWYTPTGRCWGTMVRYIWNAFTILSTYQNQIPWGGSLAFRTSLLQAIDAETLWNRTLCEDIPLRQTALAQGLRVEFVPSLLIVNQEESNLQDFIRWSGRQLLLSRLYHPAWSGMAVFGLVTTLLPIGLAVWIILALSIGATSTAQQVGLGLAIYYGVGGLIPLLMIDYGVRRVVKAWSQPIPPISFGTVGQIALGFALSYYTTIAGIVVALRARQMVWRGITYEIQSGESQSGESQSGEIQPGKSQSGYQVHMQRYRPFSDDRFDRSGTLTQSSIQ